ncbi:hypothetical protein BGZ51_006599 [Haplosporangium sp. Z 767]|nr:hypothetical protein BGZ51_006599 [Haplosporangium sp. Z 767]
MNVNATSFTPQGSGNDKPSGNATNFRSSLSSSLANESKRSNQRTSTSGNHARVFPAEQQQQHSLAVSMTQLSTGDKAARSGNNKKNQVSLNHLLNFSFPVREEPQNTGPVRRRRNANYQPFDKDKFINANFRFLLNPRSDYTVFTMDADVRVQWQDIEQVLMTVPQSCPICLQPPVAARITKCGHVYCFSCILHYLALSESNKAWRKCPICWDAIYEKDLKSVRSIQGEHDIYDQGEKEIAKQIASKQDVHLEMRLIQRSLNSTVALPRSNTFPLNEKVLPEELRGQPPLEFYPDAMHFSRLMVTTLNRMVSELERDLRAIEFSMEEAKSYDTISNSEEMVFYEMAMDKIRGTKDKIQEEAKFFPKTALCRERILRHHFNLSAKEKPVAMDTVSEESVTESARPIVIYAENGPEAYEVGREQNVSPSAQLSDDAETPAEDAELTKPDTTIIHDQNPTTQSRLTGRKPNQVTTMYYFYQAANGHHLYLQPLDIRIMKQHFETYEQFPNTITVKVLGIDETSLTEEVRKKCKYLGHLPLGCDVSFLDVDLEGIVGAESVRPFETELRLRRTKRKEKEAREERERIQREHKLNPPRQHRDELFINDPFFHVPTGAQGQAPGGGEGAATGGAAVRSGSIDDVDLQEALRLSAQIALDEMPTLSEAHARTTHRGSISHAASRSRSIPGADNGDGPMRAGVIGHADTWASSYESNESSAHGGQSTVWGTPSVPVNRHHDDYDDDYEDEFDYEPDVVVKRGKKKVTVLMTNNSRRSR